MTAGTEAAARQRARRTAAARIAELKAERDRARAIAVALEQRLAAGLALADEFEHRYDAGDHMLGCPDGAGFYDLIADQIRAALDPDGTAS